MRMKILCSTGLALLLAAAPALPASAVGEIPDSPASGFLSAEEKAPASEEVSELEGEQSSAGETRLEEEQPPAEEVPPGEEQPPAEEVPPGEEQPPAKEVPPEGEQPPAEEVPPGEEQPPAEEVPPGEEQPPAEEVPPEGERVPPETQEQETGPIPGEVLAPQGGLGDQGSGDVIDVVVPSSGEIVVNPYCLERAPDGGTATGQIIHQPQSLLNLGDLPVQVDVRAAGTVPEGSAAAFVLDPPPAGTEDKDVFLYVEFQNRTGQWLEGYVGAPNQVLVSQNTAEFQSVLTLEPRGEGFFRVSGCMSSSAAWTTDDTFGAILTFSFTALPAGEDAGETGQGAFSPEDEGVL